MHIHERMASMRQMHDIHVWMASMRGWNLQEGSMVQGLIVCVKYGIKFALSFSLQYAIHRQKFTANVSVARVPPATP